MSLLEAFFFGLLQGLTEFFPVSSSAHLKFARLLLGTGEGGEAPVLFDLVCHLGTLGALLWVLRRDLVEAWRQRNLFLLALSPLIPFYFLLKPVRTAASDLHYLGPCLIITALLLVMAHKVRLVTAPVSGKKGAFSMGVMQALALIPGISRSASTIAGGTLLGWSAPEAVRFSFLLAIPTVIGGSCLELIKLSASDAATFPLSVYIVGGLTALVSGLCVARYALAYLARGRFLLCAGYCLCLGLLISLYVRL
jgi:undecaprenyl-diphosphatase